MKITKEEIEKLSKRKQIEILYIYPKIKWIYVRFYSWYGFYWLYKIIMKDFEVPYWEQIAIWLFAMMSLYFFAREERLDGFTDELKEKE
ncbi:MAG TPA: hypothetical protein VKY37_00085 [Brumimicrobium sp.]|nr:hypothetical protein [Brumimicrobium sp.]